jgi:hypothetical protein
MKKRKRISRPVIKEGNNDEEEKGSLDNEKKRSRG